MALDADFVADCFYEPEAQLIDDILLIDNEASRVVVSTPVRADLPITKHQRVHPLFHPRHLSGGLMVHLTGIVGFVHAYYVLGLRHSEGWIGYGARINDARFVDLAHPGTPVIWDCTQTRTRRGDKKIFSRYDFVAKQDERVVYKSDQTAIWMKIEEESKK